MRRNREASILEKTFKDHLTVYRKKVVRDPESKESIEEEQAVYTDISCAFSQAGSNNPENEEFSSEKNMAAVIFTAPGIFLQNKDRVIIQTAAGQTFAGETGKTFVYSSHGETPFSPEEST